MLIVYTGANRVHAKEALLARAEKEAHTRNATIQRIEEGPHAIGFIQHACDGSTLFGDRFVYSIDSVCIDSAAQSALIAMLPALARSENTFFLFEEKPDAELKKHLKKHAGEFESFDIEKARDVGSAFAVANAFGRRDKKSAWISYMRAIAVGAAPEALHGMLFWKVKQSLLSKQRGAFSERELCDMAGELSALPHEARRQGVELEYALELFMLDAVSSVHKSS